MSNVIDITDTEPNQDLIDQLEKMLEYAKAGKIRSYISVFGWSDDRVSHGWVKDCRNSRFRLLGALSVLQTDFHLDSLVHTDSAFDKILEGDF